MFYSFWLVFPCIHMSGYCLICLLASLFCLQGLACEESLPFLFKLTFRNPLINCGILPPSLPLIWTSIMGTFCVISKYFNLWTQIWPSISFWHWGFVCWLFVWVLCMPFSREYKNTFLFFHSLGKCFCLTSSCIWNLSLCRMQYWYFCS